MQLYLAVTPKEEQEVCRRVRQLSHVAYRIGKGVLLRQELSANVRGGLLSLSDQDAPLIPNPEQLATAILRECTQRNYSGVVTDCGLPHTTDRNALLRALANRNGQNFQLLVPV